VGHLAGKDIYRRLGTHIDSLAVRCPWNATLRAILEELYTPEEADLVIQMPYSLSTLGRLREVTRLDEAALRRLLDVLCAKGLVIDVWLNDAYRYMPSPMVVGIFEFTMMRGGGGVDIKKMARLFHDYMQGDDAFYATNAGHGEKISPMRALPYEEAFDENVEVLAYEQASAIIEGHDRFSLGTCACRHEVLHATGQACKYPLNTCMSFGYAADFLIRNRFAQESSKREALEVVARSKELGLVLNADNVKKKVTFICHCCKCCCTIFRGVNQFGYPNSVVTSSWMAELVPDKCNGCGVCVDRCPVNAIQVTAGKPSTGSTGGRPKVKGNATIDERFCIGCGICVTSCARDGVRLGARGKRVLHPETTFERVILQSLERNTLQNQLFDDPTRVTHKFMRGLVGGFLRLPPVKKALMSDRLRSRFLAAASSGVRAAGKGWLIDV
jgi:ferredoxin